MCYYRACKNLYRYPNYILAVYMASGTRPSPQLPRGSIPQRRPALPDGGRCAHAFLCADRHVRSLLESRLKAASIGNSALLLISRARRTPTTVCRAEVSHRQVRLMPTCHSSMLVTKLSVKGITSETCSIVLSTISFHSLYGSCAL